MELKSAIGGLSTLEATMRRIPAVTRSKAGVKALFAGGGIVKQAAIENVKAVTATSKVTTGVLAKGLRVYRMKQKRGMLHVGVMVRKGLVNTKKIVNGEAVRVGLYASVLEFGKANQPPRPWLRPAILQNEAKVVSTVCKVFANQLDSIAEGSK